MFESNKTKQEREQLKVERDQLKGDFEKLSRIKEFLDKEGEQLKKDREEHKKQLANFSARMEELKLKEENIQKAQKENEINEYKLKSREEALNNQMENLDLLLKEKGNDLEKQYGIKRDQDKLELQELYNSKMTDFMNSVTAKMEKRILDEKKILVEDIFTFDGSAKDDVFELKKTKEGLHKEKEELERNKFLMQIDEKVSKAKEHVLEAKSSALEVKSENVDLRSELNSLAKDFKLDLFQEKLDREKSTDQVLHKLELEEERRKSDTRDVGNQISLLAEQTKGKFIELESMVSENLKELEMRTMNSFREVRENLSDMKLQFGQEILRLDGQQSQILNELEKYYIKNQEFVNKCQSLALEARKQNVEGNNLLNQVNNMYNQHKVETKAMENLLQNSLDQVAVKEGHLANSIGESMLNLKNISDQQYIAMKDMALEKKDINLLWREKNQEHEMNLQEVRHQKQDLDRMKQFLDQEKSHFSDSKSSVMDNARLTHQLYMNEHRYNETLKKVQSSQGFLTRIAKVAEFAMSKK